MAINIPDPVLAKLAYDYSNKSYLRTYDPYGIYSVSCTNNTVNTTITRRTGTTTLADTFEKELNKIMYQGYSCTPIAIDFGLIIERYK
jgi:hypothetical protein